MISTVILLTLTVGFWVGATFAYLTRAWWNHRTETQAAAASDFVEAFNTQQSAAAALQRLRRVVNS